ncbi:putative methyltransferase C9orf114 [Planococcus citri]|uniref:putative methyltransferase C9orf114 n=1 Tax=Planococcus citri TaxID=170843 RepID=UPI0031F97397
MAPKVKQPWEDLNYIKRKMKKQKTEAKLIKSTKQKEEKPPEKTSVAETPTLSIALPGSILDNAQSPELRTYLAGQIARAACIYKVDEIIVFDDYGQIENAYTAATDKKTKCCEQLATILQYLECPQYLRKYLFPIQSSLKYAGLLNPLDAPHHMRKGDQFQFREGVVLTIPPKPGRGSFVDAGLFKPVIVDKVLEPHFRVTVKLSPKAYETTKNGFGTVVSPLTPKKETGKYWGYTVRIANSLNEVFTKSPYSNGYDLTLGTSDKGACVDEIDLKSKSYTHGLIVFGGVQGLEYALENDNALEIDDVSLLFDHYINICPEQACRTIRTEEAVLITLAELRTKISPNMNDSVANIPTTMEEESS